jgi:CRP-like cAMP-binding protein
LKPPHRFGPECAFQENIEDIQLPEDTERSMFSRKPHDKLSFMSSAEVTRLEVQTLQQRVKLPRLREMVCDEFALSQGDTESRLRTDKAREDMRKDLAIAAVRAVVMKPHIDRTEMDKGILLEYLVKTDLFEGVGEELLEELAEELVLQHYNAGETICEERAILTGAHMILRGHVVMRAGASAVMLGKASAFGSSQTRGPGYVLGLPELQGRGGVQNPDAWGSSYLWTGTAKSGVQASVETLFLPAEQAQSILEKHKLQNKLEVLAKFPNTQGRSREDFMESSRVTRHGVKVPLHALFDLLELPRHEVICKMGDRPPLDQARVMLLASGTVRLKEEGKADARESILQVGAMFGEEALRGLAYEKTADVTSKLATVLVITAADYCAQFLGGKLRRDQQSQPGGGSEKTTAPRSASVQRIMKERQSVVSKQLHRLKDRRLLQQEEWHSLRPKHLLPAIQTARERR